MIGVEPGLDAGAAARRMVTRQPRWIGALMALRNKVVAPFGLKRPAPAPEGAADRIGIFPVLSHSPDRVVLGLDDKHLDFRLIVDVARHGEQRSVTATTLVRTHNALGRVYLAAVLPFHRLIARNMVERAARA